MASTFERPQMTCKDVHITNLTGHKIDLYDDMGHVKIAEFKATGTVEIVAVKSAQAYSLLFGRKMFNPLYMAMTSLNLSNVMHCHVRPVVMERVNVDEGDYTVDGLPNPSEGHIYIVHRHVALVRQSRNDLLFPHFEHRNAQGFIVGYKDLCTFAKF
jgi:hypothetical protein